MEIHARALRYFDMVRRTRSIRAAARLLHVASSAVNRQVLQLEEQLGVPLFDRLPAGLRLTPAGEIFADHVTKVLQDERRMQGALEELQGLQRGEIAIAAVEGVNGDLLPHVLEALMRRYPLLQIRQASGGSAVAAQAVVEGDADIAICYSLGRNPALRQHALGRFALGAIMPPDHPLAGRATLRFAECAAYPLILARAPLSIHDQMRQLVEGHKGPLQVKLETASVDLARQMCRRGIALAFQTRLGIEADLASGALRHVPLRDGAGRPILSELGIYASAHRSLPAALALAIEWLAAEIARREGEEAG